MRHLLHKTGLTVITVAITNIAIPINLTSIIGSQIPATYRGSWHCKTFCLQ